MNNTLYSLKVVAFLVSTAAVLAVIVETSGPAVKRFATPSVPGMSECQGKVNGTWKKWTANGMEFKPNAIQ